MTVAEKRQAVADKYKTILGRNKYSQPKRSYCYKKYSDGKYYSDCSSSIALTYRECGFPFKYDGSTCPNTVGMYLSTDLVDVPVEIKNGVIQNPEVLRVGDMLLFAGTDSSRANAGYVGHVEMVYKISGSTITICGHGSGTPSTKSLNTYCKKRYNSKTSKTKLGHKGLIRVRRLFVDEVDGPSSNDTASNTNAVQNPIVTPDNPALVNGATVRITGGSVHIRKGPGTEYKAIDKLAAYNEQYELADVSGWCPIEYKDAVRWVSSKYISNNNKCIGGIVNVRKGPDKSYKSVGYVKLGQKLTTVELDGWNPIVIDKEVFFVSKKYSK